MGYASYTPQRTAITHQRLCSDLAALHIKGMGHHQDEKRGALYSHRHALVIGQCLFQLSVLMELFRITALPLPFLQE